MDSRHLSALTIQENSAQEFLCVRAFPLSIQRDLVLLLDLEARMSQVLREVAVIAAEDTRRTAHLLARHAIATPTTSLHEHNERSKSASLVTRLQRGDHIALVSDAGTPTVSDPGGRLIRSHQRRHPGRGDPRAERRAHSTGRVRSADRHVLFSWLSPNSVKREKKMVLSGRRGGRNARLL